MKTRYFATFSHISTIVILSIILFITSCNIKHAQPCEEFRYECEMLKDYQIVKTTCIDSVVTTKKLTSKLIEGLWYIREGSNGKMTPIDQFNSIDKYTLNDLEQADGARLSSKMNKLRSIESDTIMISGRGYSNLEVKILLFGKREVLVQDSVYRLEHTSEINKYN